MTTSRPASLEVTLSSVEGLVHLLTAYWALSHLLLSREKPLSKAKHCSSMAPSGSSRASRDPSAMLSSISHRKRPQMGAHFGSATAITEAIGMSVIWTQGCAPCTSPQSERESRI